MNCDEAKQRWHDQLDDGRQDSQLAEHLARCASCARYAAQMETVLCGLDELRIQSELHPAVGDWDGRATRYGRRVRWFRPLAIGRAAAMIALCIGAYSWLEPGGARRSVESDVVQSGVVTTNRAARVPSPTAGPDAGSQAASLGMTLRGKSATQFLAVAQPTTSPDILMFRLYETQVARNPGVK